MYLSPMNNVCLIIKKYESLYQRFKDEEKKAESKIIGKPGEKVCIHKRKNIFENNKREEREK